MGPVHYLAPGSAWTTSMYVLATVLGHYYVLSTVLGHLVRSTYRAWPLVRSSYRARPPSTF